MNRLIKKLRNVLCHPFSTCWRMVTYIYRKNVFKEYHLSCVVRSMEMINPRDISLASHVYIGPHGRIEGVRKYNDVNYIPNIILKEGVCIQQDVHITCANHIIIGENTAVAAHVTITDINHPYVDIYIPVERQNLEVKEVVIGPDCKIYNGAIILPGVHIGKHCVVGANSVVTRDIPDYSVAVGAPARVIKQYNFETHEWEKRN